MTWSVNRSRAVLGFVAALLLALAPHIAGAADAKKHPAVEELSHRGVLKGYPNGKFKPDKPVTRLELAVILARTLRAIEAKAGPVTAPKLPADPAAEPPAKPSAPPPAKGSAVPRAVPQWARADFQYLAGRGYTEAQPKLCQDLRRPVTEKELAGALVWMLSSLAEKGYVAPGDLNPPPPEP